MGKTKQDENGYIIPATFEGGYPFPRPSGPHKAMQIIYNHVLLDPELKDELKTVILDQIDNNSVGFMSRGRRIIKQMEKL